MKNEGIVEAGLYSDGENVCELNRASHVGVVVSFLVVQILLQFCVVVVFLLFLVGVLVRSEPNIETETGVR